MPYRFDHDLEFLQYCTDKELDDLVNLLIFDNPRLTEDLTYKDIYKKYTPQHSKYWKEIACEIQCFGANSVATIFRDGQGVLYREILFDVCNKLKVTYHKNDSTTDIEMAMLTKTLGNAIQHMTTEQRLALAKEINITDLNGLTPQIIMVAAQAIFRQGGFKSYKLSLIIVNAVMKTITGKGLKFAANATLTKTLSILTGPVGWTITGA